MTWRLLDNLVKDLRTNLFAKKRQDIAVELDKRQKALQNMVEEMLAEHKAQGGVSGEGRSSDVCRSHQ